jgi:hypothetical protein
MPMGLPHSKAGYFLATALKGSDMAPLKALIGTVLMSLNASIETQPDALIRIPMAA